MTKIKTKTMNTQTIIQNQARTDAASYWLRQTLSDPLLEDSDEEILLKPTLSLDEEMDRYVDSFLTDLLDTWPQSWYYDTTRTLIDLNPILYPLLI